MPIDMPGLLQLVIDRAASDLHLKADQPPIIRVAGKLSRLNLPAFTPEEVHAVVCSILTPEQITQFENKL